jgi:hypothetical protein
MEVLKFWILIGFLALLCAFFLQLIPSFHDKYIGVAKNEAPAVDSLICTAAVLTSPHGEDDDG